MQTDSSGILPDALALFIHDTFPAGDMESILFVPKGEGGYAYAARNTEGVNYFIKAEKAQPDVLNRCLTEVYRLRYDYGKQYVLAPLLSKKGKAAEPFGSYSISLFPYMEGISVYEKESVKADLEAAAWMMADLHQIHSRAFNHLPREQFHNPFRETLLKLLDTAGSHSYAMGSYPQQLAALLLEERDDLLGVLQMMEDKQEQFLLQDTDFCITHGDANYANMMCDYQGNLHLIDWGELALGPPERDLMSYTEEYFGTFLQAYLKHRPQTKLQADLFEFYLYRWCLQEIADYGSSLLLQLSSEEVYRHSWIEIQPYLPVRHQAIKSDVMLIRREIEKYSR